MKSHGSRGIDEGGRASDAAAPGSSIQGVAKWRQNERQNKYFKRKKFNFLRSTNVNILNQIKRNSKK
jgi:hypothetical protein